MKRRRADAPSLMSCRSSGQKKTVFRTALRSDAARTGTSLMVILFFLPKPTSIRLTKSRSREWIEPSRWNPSCSKRMSSRSVRVRLDFPVDRQTMASSRLVFPWAFSPQMTLQVGSKRTSWAA